MTTFAQPKLKISVPLQEHWILLKDYYTSAVSQGPKHDSTEKRLLSSFLLQSLIPLDLGAMEAQLRKASG